MKKYLTTILFVLSTAGCNFDPSAGPPTFCVEDADCLAGRVCASGACVDEGGPVELDAGPRDTSADAGPGEPCGVDNDGDGFFDGLTCDADELDCNDADPDIFPGAPQRCNGEDNDCDGIVDTPDCECTDGIVGECGTTTGVCQIGMRTCNGGIWGSCEGGVDASDEACNGLDDDCDGTVDEGCPCTDGDTQGCGSGTGECQPGTQRCVNGEWSDCEGAVGPADELCNTLDDDCDGEADENTIDSGMPCDSGEDGVCSAGAEVCQTGTFVCEAIRSPRNETCNGLDDNCDGTSDEDVSQNCMSACGPGTQECSAGTFGTCVPTNPPAELCNGTDDDCDGVIDETFPEEGAPCDTGEPGICAAGASTCKQGAIVCSRQNNPTAEVCDGVDNDCDGLIDEDTHGRVLAESCGGSCPNGSVRLCENGAWSDCDRAEMELCNNADDNCDGVADNQAVCYQRCPGGGIAAGTLTCPGSACDLPPEICGDNIDNDCDGVVDQNCDSSVGDMAYVPGGTFLMGSRANAPYSAADELPIHVVELKPFYIDRFEVSRADYGRCVLSGSCGLLRQGCPLQLSQQQDPITCVTWEQARDFCAWEGKRLPTEAEWEKAARGPFRREVLWPWGDSETLGLAAMACTNNLNSCMEQVTSLPAGQSYYGLHHMAGNAAEWVSDYYDPAVYPSGYTVQPEVTTPTPDGHVVRGGSTSQDLEFGRVANRAVADFVLDEEIGFRCAK